MSFYQKYKKEIHTVGGIALAIVTLAIILPKKDTTGNGGRTTDHQGNLLDPSGNIFKPQEVAQQLYNVMSSWGKDSATVLDILKKRVPANGFNDLKSAFGTPQYNWLTGGTALGSNRDLIFWLKEELTSEHYITVKSLFPNQPWL